MEQAANYIALAIPVFFLLIGVELLVARLKQTSLYRFNDAIANISCGIGQQVLGIFLKTVVGVGGYLWIYSNYRLLDLGADQWWVWVVCFLGVDFFYYWFHRYAHEISFLWGGHIVHHQSEEYNLSVALRQGAFQSATSWVFYLPLAFIGFAPPVFIVLSQFNTLYQFWIHTKAIDRMPRWFEFIFNTPSHHRVHHGVNPQYIDKNHAGTLIIWDRLFGTFEPEREEVVYGITKPLASWNPVWANFDYMVDAFRLAFKCRTVGDFFRVFFKGPGWRPEYLGGPQKPQQVTPSSFPKYDTHVTPALNYYVLAQYVILLVGTSLFLFKADGLAKAMPGWEGHFWKVVLAGLIVATIVSLGALLENRRWAVGMEIGRLVLSGVALAAMVAGTPNLLYVVGSAVLYAGLSVAALIVTLKGANAKHLAHGAVPHHSENNAARTLSQ